VYARPEYIDTLADVDGHREPREGRFRAARLPRRTTAAPRGDLGALGWQKARRRGAFGVRRVQAAPGTSASWSRTARLASAPSRTRLRRARPSYDRLYGASARRDDEHEGLEPALRGRERALGHRAPLLDVQRRAPSSSGARKSSSFAYRPRMSGPWLDDQGRFLDARRGEGALRDQFKGEQTHVRRAQHLRAAALLRGVLADEVASTGPHRRAHLRDLPRGVSNERLPRDEDALG